MDTPINSMSFFPPVATETPQRLSRSASATEPPVESAPHEGPTEVAADRNQVASSASLTTKAVDTPLATGPATASAEQVRDFCQVNRNLPATSIVRVGDNFHVVVGGQRLAMPRQALETGLRSGAINGETVFARSLMVFEAAHNAGLPGHAQRAIVQAFAADVSRPDSKSFKAMRNAMASVALAVQVEAYVKNPGGLAQDMSRVSRLAAMAKSGGIPAMASLGSRQQAKTAKTSEQQLRQALQAFSGAIASAHDTGDYAKAYDSLEAFFKLSASVTADPYWSRRMETRGQELATTEMSNAGRFEVTSSLMEAASQVPADALTREEPMDLQSMHGMLQVLERDVATENNPDVGFARIGKRDDVEVRRKQWYRNDAHEIVETATNGAYTQYLSVDGRKPFEMRALNTLDEKGNQHTLVAADIYQDPVMNGAGIVLQDRNIFAMAPDGTIYVGHHLHSGTQRDDGIVAHLHHSSFLSGQPVAAAGEIYCNANGEIVKVTNESGHYLPGAQQLAQVLKQLAKLGVDLSKVEVELKAHDTTRSTNTRTVPAAAKEIPGTPPDPFKPEAEGPTGFKTYKGNALAFLQSGVGGAERTHNFAVRSNMQTELTNLQAIYADNGIMAKLRRNMPDAPPPEPVRTPGMAPEDHQQALKAHQETVTEYRSEVRRRFDETNRAFRLGLSPAQVTFAVQQAIAGVWTQGDDDAVQKAAASRTTVSPPPPIDADDDDACTLSPDLSALPVDDDDQPRTLTTQPPGSPVATPDHSPTASPVTMVLPPVEDEGPEDDVEEPPVDRYKLSEVGPQEPDHYTNVPDAHLQPPQPAPAPNYSLQTLNDLKSRAKPTP